MPGYDWRTSGESAGGPSYPVSRPSKPSRPPGQPSSGPHIGYGGVKPQTQTQTSPVVPGGYVDPGGDDEKTDYFDETYVSPQTGKTVKTMQEEAYAASQAQEAARMAQVQQSQSLANALKSGNINEEQLQHYMSSGILPGHIAEKGGLAEVSGYDTHGNPIYVDPTTGNPYNPRGKFTAGMSEGLSDLQFMQDEGVYGGVSGLEAEVNRQKGSIVRELGKMKTQGLNSNQIKERLKQDPNFESLAKLHGYEGLMDDIFDPTDTAAGSVGDWIMANTTQPEPGAKGLGAVGYDPTGVHSWREIEETAGRYGARDPKTGMLVQGDWTPNESPNSLYNKYLNRGENWDDPLSGILEPPREVHQGGSGYNYRTLGQAAYDRKMALLRALRKGSPIKNLEKSGFMASMKDPYAPEMIETGEKGIFSKTTLAGLKPKDMQRLIKSWGSGYSNPVHANVAARGGIMSVWNDMRR